MIPVSGRTRPITDRSVVDFPLPTIGRSEAGYQDIPGRWQVARAYCSPRGISRLPDAPGLGNVLVRAMMMSRQPSAVPGAMDRVLSPPLPTDMGILDWSRHTELMAAAYSYADAEIDAALARGDSAFSAIVETSRGRTG